ncbi:MAG: hypothetical protein ACM3SR_00365 [Ignavibacteriales bacterium]
MRQWFFLKTRKLMRSDGRLILRLRKIGQTTRNIKKRKKALLMFNRGMKKIIREKPLIKSSLMQERSGGT